MEQRPPAQQQLHDRQQSPQVELCIIAQSDMPNKTKDGNGSAGKA
jgi:hypothetical protein